MATMYTSFSEDATDGERRFFRKLEANLPDEFMVWQGVEVEGKKGKKREIDFIVFHPIYGVWVIEVKDWQAGQILSTGEKNWEILERGKPQVRRSPFAQVRENKYTVKDALQRHVELKHAKGLHKGKLKVPIHSLVVFVNISSDDLEGITRKDLREKLLKEKAWLQDILDDPFADEKEWQEKFLQSRDVKFQSDLSLPEIEKVKESFGVPKVFAPSGESVGTLDAYQRRLVEMNPNRHLVIEGPAGSGKSVVLIKRAVFLAKKHSTWTIGVMCYNALMGQYLRTLISGESENKAILSRIKIWDVFQWANEHLPVIRSLYSQVDDPRKAIGLALDKSDSWPQYDALLVDEGQDADENLLRLYRSVLKEEGHLTLFYDNRQMLYTNSPMVERLEAAGFAGTKEKALVKQQRSVLILLALAFFERLKKPDTPPEELLQRVLTLGERMFFDVKNLVLGLVTGLARLFTRKGGRVEWKKEIESRVQLVRVSSCRESVREVVNNLALRQDDVDALVLLPQRRIKRGIFDEEMDVASLLREELRKRGVSYVYVDLREGQQFLEGRTTSVGDNRRSVDLGISAVKIMTIHTSKGLDAKEVHVLGFDILEDTFPGKVAEVGYVALTRAKEKVYVYYQNEHSTSVQALIEARQNLLKKR